MPRCFVSTCGNYYSRPNQKQVRYHTFPLSKSLAELWVFACKGQFAPSAPKYARVCSEHFSASCYKRDLQHELLGLPVRHRLKPDAVPDMNLPMTEAKLFLDNKRSLRIRDETIVYNDKKNRKKLEDKKTDAVPIEPNEQQTVIKTLIKNEPPPFKTEALKERKTVIKSVKSLPENCQIVPRENTNKRTNVVIKNTKKIKQEPMEEKSDVCDQRKEGSQEKRQTKTKNIKSKPQEQKACLKKSRNLQKTAKESQNSIKHLSSGVVSNKKKVSQNPKKIITKRELSGKMKSKKLKKLQRIKISPKIFYKSDPSRSVKRKEVRKTGGLLMNLDKTLIPCDEGKCNVKKNDRNTDMDQQVEKNIIKILKEKKIGTEVDVIKIGKTKEMPGLKKIQMKTKTNEKEKNRAKVKKNGAIKRNVGSGIIDPFYDYRLPVRSSIRIAKKKSIFHTSGPGIEPKSPRSKEIYEKIKFLARFNLRYGYNPGKDSLKVNDRGEIVEKNDEINNDVKFVLATQTACDKTVKVDIVSNGFVKNTGLKTNKFDARNFSTNRIIVPKNNTRFVKNFT